MGRDKSAELSEMAAELCYLREDATAAGQPFLAYLFGMAATEAERLSEEPARTQAKELLERALSASGKAERPGSRARRTGR